MKTFAVNASWFTGAISLEHDDGGLCPFRLDKADRDLLHPDLLAKAEMAAGVRLRLITSSRTLALHITCHTIAPDAERFAVDLVLENETVERRPVGRGREVILWQDLPPGEKTLDIWLPHFCRTTVHAVEVDDQATLAPAPALLQPRWLTYGSSITHCRAAPGPSMTWPAIVARSRGLNLTCLGFGGECRFEPLVGRTIARMPADLISMKLGINTWGGSYIPRTWQQAVIGLVLSVRDGHPDTPLLIISPIFAVERDANIGASGMSLTMMREQLGELVAKCQARGDNHIGYLHGHELLGPDDAHLLSDGVHPTPEGYATMAKRFLDRAWGPSGLFAQIPAAGATKQP